MADKNGTMPLEIYQRAERLSKLVQIRLLVAELQNDAALGRLVRNAEDDRTLIEACDAMLSAITWANSRFAAVPEPADPH